MRRRVPLFLAGTAVAALVARQRRASPSAEPLAMPPGGNQQRLITSDGAELTIEIVDPAPDAPTPVGASTVLLAHCWIGDIHTWGPVTAELSQQGYRVVRWYQRGHGPSTVGRDGFAIDRFGDDAAEIIEFLDLNDIVLAGHSLGGMTAQSFAVRHPEVASSRVKAMVLVATGSGGMAKTMMGKFAEPILTNQLTDKALAGAAGPSLVRGALGKGATKDAITLTLNPVRQTSPATRNGILSALLVWDVLEARRQIDLPVTVAVGTRDTITPPGMSRGIAAALPDAQLHVFPGRGHMLPLEIPSEIARLIAAAARR